MKVGCMHDCHRSVLGREGGTVEEGVDSKSKCLVIMFDVTILGGAVGTSGIPLIVVTTLHLGDIFLAIDKFATTITSDSSTSVKDENVKEARHFLDWRFF